MRMGSSQLTESGVVTPVFMLREKSSVNDIVHEITLRTPKIALGFERKPNPSLPA
jgi:hypothetical protein